jgi:hypothetical protein
MIRGGERELLKKVGLSSSFLALVECSFPELPLLL